MLGEIWLIFALNPKLKTTAETFVFQSHKKFLCFVIQFHDKFWFWCQTRILSKKVYAGIYPLLEITSLKFLDSLIIDKKFDFALNPKLKLAAETLVFQSDQKFLCFVVQFHEKFWFLCQIRIVAKKVYAGICPVLEITSLSKCFWLFTNFTFILSITIDHIRD